MRIGWIVLYAISAIFQPETAEDGGIMSDLVNLNMLFMIKEVDGGWGEGYCSQETMVVFKKKPSV